MSHRVVLVRHGDNPADDRATTYFGQAGFEIDSRRPFAGELLGEPDEKLAGTVIYGGLFNVYETDRHPFLLEEYRWIGACMDAGVPVLGICQGAQQIAHFTGAWVGARADATEEFGYYRIDPTAEAGDFLDRPLWVTQAHYHTFDLPQGAVRLAGNATYENQAFRLGNNVYGLQFHAEVTIEGFRRWQVANTANYGRPNVQDRAEQNRLMYLHDAAQADWFYGFLGRLFGTCADRF